MPVRPRHHRLSADQSRATMSGNGNRGPRITIAHRSPVRLMYPSLEEARREHVARRDETPDPVRDVCPKTGTVFRDSGLRHESRALYCAVWEGQLPNVALRRVSELDDGLGLLRSADLIVQATGYVGQTPRSSWTAGVVPTDRAVGAPLSGGCGRSVPSSARNDHRARVWCTYAHRPGRSTGARSERHLPARAGKPPCRALVGSRLPRGPGAEPLPAPVPPCRAAGGTRARIAGRRYVAGTTDRAAQRRRRTRRMAGQARLAQ